MSTTGIRGIAIGFLLTLAFLALTGAQGWLTEQYEWTWRGWRPVATRRWYGKNAHVCLRADADDVEAPLYLVHEWNDDDTSIPWLRVQAIDDDSEPEAFWGSVSNFAPYSVRRLRPWLFRYGWFRYPVLFDYRPLRQPSGHLGNGA
jgi:hypothetical protein